MDGQTQQQPTSLNFTKQPQVAHVRFYKDELQELIHECEASGAVTVAVRIFPADEYQWHYARSVVLIARARLEASGRTAQLKTEMDSRESRIILTVTEPERSAIGEVQAIVKKSANAAEK